MTLGDFFSFLAAHPAYVIGYFIAIPFAALLAGWLDGGKGYASPWKYLYSTFIYMVCVPGLASLALTAYVFLFEQNSSIFDANIFAQILPIISMLVTLQIVRRNVKLEYVPGFNRLSGLFIFILATLAIMYFLDRTRIIAFTFLPVWFVILIFLGILWVMMYGWSKVKS